MRGQSFVSVGVAILAVMTLVPASSAEQAPSAKPLRTPWGDPDLQGTWSNSTIVPLQRPGAMNLITPGKRQQAAALVRTGTVVSLSRDLPRDKHVEAPARRGGTFTQQFHIFDHDVLHELQAIDYHGSRLSHIDALCHVSYNGTHVDSACCGWS